MAKKINRSLIEYGITIAVAITIALLIRNYVFESFRIPSQVMKPNLLAGDFIFASKVKKKSEINYGDVVIYSPPEDLNKTYIKRVLGLPKDRIMIHQGRLSMNDQELEFIPGPKNDPNLNCGKEIHPSTIYTICIAAQSITDPYEKIVPEDSYFLVGDHRGTDISARGWDIIPKSAIKSKVNLIWFSIQPNLEEKLGLSERIRWNRLLKTL